MSREHVWSAWIGELFPFPRFGFRRTGSGADEWTDWQSPNVNIVCKAVCKQCNEGWMSNLESQQAKPAMKDMIVPGPYVRLTPQRIAAIAAFAFKTAVLADEMNARPKDLFFPATARQRFAHTLRLPSYPSIGIFLSGLSPEAAATQGHLKARYSEFDLEGDTRCKLYSMTWPAGRLAIQLVSFRSVGPTEAKSILPHGFEDAVIQIWPVPEIPPGGLIWPPSRDVGSDTFEKFSNRWISPRALFQRSPA